jgi:sulfate adenylyltransferase
MMIEAHGGRIINRIVPQEDREAFSADLRNKKKYYLSEGNLSVFHRLADGTLSPLEGPMTGKEFYKVLDEEHIERNGEKLAWTIPLAFPIDQKHGKTYTMCEDVAVLSPSGELIGSLRIEDIYPFEKRRYLESVYGTARTDHPGARSILSDKREYLLGGKISALPQKWDERFKQYMLSPLEARSLFKKKGWERVIAFQTRNPLHRAHEYAMVYALERVTKDGLRAGVVLNPLVGETKDDDVIAHVRMECYRVLIEKGLLGLWDADENLWAQEGCTLCERALLIGLDMKMFYAGPKEAVMHAIYRQNMGFTDIIIGRRHADAPFDDGTPIWGDFDAQEKFSLLNGELKIKNLNVGFAAYFEELERVGLVDEHKGLVPFTISGSQIRQILQRGEKPDPRIVRPEVAEILIRYYNDPLGS